MDLVMAKAGKKKKALARTPKCIQVKKRPKLKLVYVPIQELSAWKSNPRTNDKAAEKLAKLFAEHGFINPIIATPDKTIRAGHTRLKAASKTDLKELPVLFVPFDSELEAQMYSVSDNKASEWSEWDHVVLLDVIAQVKKIDPNRSNFATGFTRQEIDFLGLRYGAGGKTDPDLVLDRPKRPKCRRGDLWVLGGTDGHRLLCGDATKKSDVSKLLGCVQPYLMVTDPPYGVDYKADWRVEAALKGRLVYPVRRIGRVLQDTRYDWTAAWELSPSSVVYCWFGSLKLGVVKKSLESQEFIMRNLIIWSKPHFVLSRGHYNWGHEPCWYAVKKNCQANWIGDAKQSTVWEISLDKNVEGGHSTQKPVECMSRGIRNHTGDVYDPFVGSGTTIIACEQLNRRCFAIDLDAAYCDVALQRWADFTGKDPMRESDGKGWSQIQRGLARSKRVR